MVRSRHRFAGLVLVCAGLAIGSPPLDAQTAIRGEVRVRREAEHDRSAPGSELHTLLRTRVQLSARPGARVGALVQFQDARVFGEEASTLLDGSADRIDVHQAYGWVRGEVSDLDLEVKAGRQEIVSGNERLIGAVGWSNTGRSFDALRADLSPASGRWAAMAFVATVSERGRFGPAPTAGGDHTLFGAQLEHGALHLLVTHDRNAAYRAWSDVDRSTLSARWMLPIRDGPTVDVEGSYQFGSQDVFTGSETIAAWLFAARLTGLSLGSSDLTVGVDWLSGDDDVTDARYTAFNTLYGTNHKWYGLMDFFLDPATRTGDRGLVDALVGTSFELGRVPVSVTAHRFWFAEGRGTGRDLGYEVDLTASVPMPDDAALQIGYGGFVPGASAASANLGPDGDARHWAFAQLTIRF